MENSSVAEAGRLTRMVSRANAAAERFLTALEASPAIFLIWFSVPYFLGALILASRRPFWMDEIITVHITGLPGIRAIWSALLNATDGNPPLHYALTRPFLTLLGPGEISLRLLPIAAFWIACVSVFSFVRRIASTAAAGIAVLLLAQSGAYHWATETRPYATALCFAALALVCWQRCTEAGRRRLWLSGLFLSMACLVSLHYYSLLLVIPLAAGEAVRWFIRKKPDWPVWLAIGAGASAILLWLPILASVRSNVRGNMATLDYFAAPSIPGLYAAYTDIFQPWIVPAALCLVLICAGMAAERWCGRESRLDGPSAAVLAGLCLLPLLVFALAVAVTHTFATRYVLAGALGLSMMPAIAVSRWTAGRAAVAAGVLAVLLGHMFWHNVLVLPAEESAKRSYAGPLQFLERDPSGLPIVVTEGLQFVPLWYYAPPAFRARLVYVTDLPFAQRTADTTNEIIVQKLKPMFGPAVADIADFVASHKEFLVYYRGISSNSSLDDAAARGCTTDLVRKSGPQLLFRCRCK